MICDCSLGLTLFKSTQGRTYRCEDLIENNVPIFAGGLRRDQLPR